MIKLICKLSTGDIKEVNVDPDEHLYVLLKKLNIVDKNTKFAFKGMTYSLSSILTFREIGLTHDAKIFILNPAIAAGGGGIKLICQFGTNKREIVFVDPEESLYVLLKKLNIVDKNTKFIFQGTAYSLSSILTFREIGLTHEAKIYILNQAIAGGPRNSE